MKIKFALDIGASISVEQIGREPKEVHRLIELRWHFANCECRIWLTRSSFSFMTIDLSSTDYNSWIRQYDVLFLRFAFKDVLKRKRFQQA